jgi:argininosuccinate lyase
MSAASKEKKLWGGRFAGDTAPLVERYTCSVGFDSRLCVQDIEGSKAHASMLAEQGIITTADCEAIHAGLEQIRAEIEAGTFVWRQDLEDVHMNIEHRLTEIVGTPGQKLHTGRSRNDQVALDFRLFVATSLDEWAQNLRALIGVLVQRADEHQRPFCRAAPISSLPSPSVWPSTCWLMPRCFGATTSAYSTPWRVRVSPLGAAALAGTTHPLDPGQVAARWGLAAPSPTAWTRSRTETSCWRACSAAALS